VKQHVATTLLALFLLAGLALAQHEKPAPPAPAGQPTHEQQKQAKPAEPAHREGTISEGLSSELAETSREAAGEEEGHAEFKHSSSVRWIADITGLSLQSAYWLAVLFNFAVIAAAIVWFSKSSLPQMFRARTRNIQKTMEEARRSSEDAGKRLEQIEGRLAKLDAEIAAMRSAADAEAAEEEERIRLAAEEDRRKIVESTAAEIQAAARLAQRELKAYAAELAVSLAEKRITVDPTTDRALVETFVQQLGNQRDGKEGS
jgi:F-type H+-transporting ATPase subunit b